MDVHKMEYCVDIKNEKKKAVNGLTLESVQDILSKNAGYIA